MSAELAVPHTPVTHMHGGAHPEEPEFDDICAVCCCYWPCTIAWLSGLDEIWDQRARAALDAILGPNRVMATESEVPF